MMLNHWFFSPLTFTWFLLPHQQQWTVKKLMRHVLTARRKRGLGILLYWPFSLISIANLWSTVNYQRNCREQLSSRTQTRCFLRVFTSETGHNVDRVCLLISNRTFRLSPHCLVVQCVRNNSVKIAAIFLLVPDWPLSFSWVKRLPLQI